MINNRYVDSSNFEAHLLFKLENQNILYYNIILPTDSSHGGRHKRSADCAGDIIVHRTGERLITTPASHRIYHFLQYFIYQSIPPFLGYCRKGQGNACKLSYLKINYRSKNVNDQYL